MLSEETLRKLWDMLDDMGESGSVSLTLTMPQTETENEHMAANSPDSIHGLNLQTQA